MNKKIIAFLLSIIILIIFIIQEIRITTIDDLDYVVALGLDTGDNNLLKVSFEIATTNDNNSSSSSSQTQSNSTITTVEASSIDSAIDLINTYISKEVTLSHCKIIVISEELATGGISNYLYTLINKMEVSPKCNIIVSRVNCEYFLKESTSSLEKNSTDYYQIISTTADYTGYTDYLTLSEFFSRMGDSFSQPYTILGSINLPNNSTASVLNTEINNDVNVTSKNKVEIAGLAVFNADTLVGELNAMETTCYLILSNKLHNATISIPSPFNNFDTIDLYLSLMKDTNFDIKILNSTPYVVSNVYIDARILTINKDSDYLDEENLIQIEEYANSYLKSHIMNYFYKTSKEYKSDILGLGKYVVSDFVTWDEWIKYDWLSKYEDSFFDVNVDIDVKSGYLLLET